MIYHIYPKHWHPKPPTIHIHPATVAVPEKLLDEWAKSVDPDQMQHSVASDLGLHCLVRPVSYYNMYSSLLDSSDIINHNHIFLKILTKLMLLTAW